MKKEPNKGVLAITVNVLIKKEDDIFIAHCLELDIVATANTAVQIEKDIISLIDAQISYAFSNNNLDNLYHPAPPETWKAFFACKEKIEKRHKVTHPKKDKPSQRVIPPWIITNTCLIPEACHA